MTDTETQAPEPEKHGMTRRQLARHTAWFGSAVVLAVTGGEVISHVAHDRDSAASAVASSTTALRFVQISDSHIGFTGPANMDVAGSFSRAIDQVKQMMTGLRTGRVFTVPGEHDSVDDQGRAYRAGFARGTQGDGWYSFDTHGVHFIALVNTLSLEALGHLGTEQIDFVRKDVAGLSSDTPIVVFSHIPLFAMYPRWGWSTDDALQVLNLLKRFASVTALNGHVHQLFTRVEGNVTFHSATTTAYPLPKPGAAPAPTPQVLPARQLQAALGIRTVAYRSEDTGLAITDSKLA